MTIIDPMYADWIPDNVVAKQGARLSEKSIYLAGSSKEIDRIEPWIAKSSDRPACHVDVDRRDSLGSCEAR